ncbi:nucleotidyl transferase AbiEii/AbiGii toxin family protein [Nonomuraea sp. CA-218870]|uniref:nucleotidyl transferase AbiEii/AbiGii toxin family protein n=1 Tax=Nonomuraea sp. CA-218870 TaxID=3239998 RepID=UPI003D8EDE83
MVYWLIPMLSAGQAWPQASESALWRLRDGHRDGVQVYAGSLDPAGKALRTIASEWNSPARPTSFTRIGRMYDEKTGVLAKMGGHTQYARQVDAFALETQYSKISINVAFWVAVIAISIALISAFFSAGASTAAVGTTAAGLRATIAGILSRLGLAASRPIAVTAATRLTTLAGSSLAGRLGSAVIARELVEEIGEEVFIDAYTQLQQIKMGTRSSYDWDKSLAAALGAGTGAVVGTKLANPVSAVTNAIPGIGRLNRTAADLPGWGNAFRRFPGRALNTGLNNMVASPAGSFVANGLVYGQWSPPTADSLLGGFMGSAGRTNSISPFDPGVAGALLDPVAALDHATTTAAATDLARAGTTAAPAGLQSSLNDTGPSSGRPGQATGPDNSAQRQPGTLAQPPNIAANPGGGTRSVPSAPASFQPPANPDPGQPATRTPGDVEQRGRQGSPPTGGQEPDAGRRPEPTSRIDDLINAPADGRSELREPAPPVRSTEPGSLEPAAAEAATDTPGPATTGTPGPGTADAPAREPAGVEPASRGATPGDGTTTAVGVAAASLDHAIRTPVLNVEPAPGPPQQLANALDARAVPLAPHWEGLRSSAAAAPVTVTGLPAPGAVPVEARRLLVPWRGSQRLVTEFTVRVPYRAAPGMTEAEIATAHANLLKGVDLYYNYRHELPDGSQLHVRMEFEPAPPSVPDDRVVLLYPGTGHRAVDFADRDRWHGEGEVITTPLDQLAAYRGRPPIHFMSWYAEMEPVVFAHETLHLFGMFDEYVDPRSADRRHLADSAVHVDANLLGQATLFWAQGRPVLDRDGRTVAEATSLRDRHLLHLHALVLDLPRPKVPLDRPAAPVNPEEWSRPAYEPAAHLPGDVRGLLERFPPGDRPLMEHLRLLERTNLLFGDGQRVTRDHLTYTDALVTTARLLFGTGPEYSFSAQELHDLRRLSTLLLGDQPPGPDVLRQRINVLLSRDPSAPVTPAQVQALASVSATVTPVPGEPGPSALLRGVRDQLGPLPAAGEAPARSAPDAAGGLRASHSPHPQDGSPRQFLRFWRHLMNEVRVEADRRGTTPLDELQQFALQRALARIFVANPDDWMLKGGQAMLSRNPGGRASTDVDLVRMSGDARPDVMAAEYEAALARDHGDHLRFERESMAYILHGKAVRISHKVYCGDMEIMSLSADLAPPRTRPVWKEPDVIPFPRQILTTGHPDESPPLRVISLDDTLAHKVSGMYTHGIRTLETRCDDCISRGGGLFSCKSGDLPYRTQDLVDVLMIIINSPWDGPATHDMLHREFAWRLEQGENLKVPPAFEVPSPDWFRKFDGYARTTPGLPYAGLSDAVPVAQAFLDPLLREEPPPPSRWDPERRQWVPAEGSPEPAAADDGIPARTGSSDVTPIRLPRSAPPSAVHAEPGMVSRWDDLSAGGLDAQLGALKARVDLSPAEKLQHIVGRMMYDNAYVLLTSIPGPDNANLKHLRFYSHQRGELYSHAAALMADPELTIEIAFEPDRGRATYEWDAHQAHVAHLGPVPAGVPAYQADAAVMRRLVRGESIADADPATLVDDLVELQAKPLRDALGLRQRLIEDYGIEPHRVRLAFANSSQKLHYSATQWMRAQYFALQAIRADPVRARQRMIDRMLGPDPATAERRSSRARAVVERLRAANDQADAYALLWVRDTRGQPVGGRHGPHLDTRPEILRQTIEAIRAEHPARRIVLLGDDVFAGRPGLAEAWRDAGVLDGVDTETLVRFWEAARNGGETLGYGEQALFFHELNSGHDVVQVGMESGALEIPAMLGVPTVYFEAREHDGNKGNRWLLYWQRWAYEGSDSVPAALPAMRRLLFGPDLPDPENRRGQPVAVYDAARVAVTMDRIDRLVRSGEMDRWPQRLGRSVAMRGEIWMPWSEADWRRSAYYAEQLRRWLGTDARTPEEIGRKWHAIRLTLLGVLEPRFTTDEEYEGVSVVHPYTVLHRERNQIDRTAIRISQAYATDLSRRSTAVAEVLKSLLATPDFIRRGVADLRVFQLDQPEIAELRQAVSRVTAPAAEPYAARLDTPPAGGGPTPREVLERFDASAAGLTPVTAEEAADHIARNAARRPWLAAAANLDPAVQRVLVAVDLGQGHHLARHEGYAADGRLEGRVARLEDPAQTDPSLRARSTDAFRPGDAPHRAPDTATAINDPVAFAVAFARAVEHPDVRRALTAPFDPDRRPGRVSLPISELLGPDGHLYCSGYRIVSGEGGPEAAVANRWQWVLARRDPDRRHEGPEPLAAPMESFAGGTVELFFQPTRERNGYEISTMFVDPPARRNDG